MRSAALIAIALYQRILSPYMPGACRYEPTCSHYAQDAIRAHGLPAGGWLALKRLARCHPWGGRGYDPAPPPRRKDNTHAGAGAP